MSFSFSARGVRPRVFALLGVSAIALGAGLASPAAAQCSPEPTVPNGTTSCTGTDANGVRITTSGTTLRVEPSATVTNSGAPAVAVDIPANGSFPSRTASIIVAGQVAGASNTGIDILSGSVPSGSFDSSGTRVAIAVASGGSVTGVNGIVVRPSSNNSFGPALASVDNAGTISGSSGIALLASSPNLAGFTAITNRSGGLIGAISGPVGTLTNAGTIDGGGRSAFDAGTTFNNSIFTSTLTNSGTIRSSSSAATVANLRSGQTFVNSGSVQNSGTGPAIGGDAITLTNSSTGLIRTAGSTAISAASSLNLINTGRIDGNVVAGPSQGFANGSVVDSTAGIINGGLTFGAGNDVLIARYTGSPSLSTGVTGPVDAGAGTDTLRIRFDANTEVTSPVTVPASFERLGLAPAAGVTATLSPAFNRVGTVQVTGAGTLINRGTLEGPGQVLVADDFSSSPRIVNAGTITSTTAASNVFAVALNNVFSFANEGSVNAAGSGVSFSSEGGFSNSGTINAAGTGVSLFGPKFTNSGTIRSTGGTGLILNGSTVLSDSRINSGRIEGATVGVSLSTNFTNAGTIASSGTGVLIQSNGFLDNRSGAVVTGGTRAIGPTTGSFVTIFNAAVVNAGTINGDVSLASSGSGFFTNNRFFAERGGVLNGNLALGTGDYLVTELVNPSPGRFAGITGTVTASNSFLRLRVREDATASFAPVAGFQSVGYELFNNAALTLTGSAPSNQPISFAGTGSVDLTADIATLNQTTLLVSSLITGTGFSSAAGTLNITNRGNLSVVHNDQGMSPPFAVAIGGRDSFTNAGTITISERATRVFSPMVAISGGANVVNSGTISLDGGIGVRGSTQLTNSGSIVQASGGATAQGVEGVGRVVNSGLIQVGGTAVSLGGSFQPGSPPTLVNSGTIASTAGTAVRAANFGSVIENQAGGSISGPVAIAAFGGTVVNAGAITGTVQLSFAPFGGTSFLPGAFVSAGGTVNGSVLFGAGDDLFLQLGETTGVTGRIVGGDGFDTFGRVFSTSSTVGLGAPGGEGFEAQLIQARGADTVVTLTAADPIAGTVFVGGDGRIINQAVIDGRVSTYLPFFFGPQAPAALGADLVLAEFRNEGTIRGGFDGAVRGFVNTGSIGSTNEEGDGVDLQGQGDLRFDNAGQIASGSEEDAVELSVFDARTVSFANSGSIGGGVGIYLTSASSDAATSLSIVNTGSIATTGEETGAVFIETNTASPTSVSFDNRGTVSASGALSKAVVAILNPSEGGTTYSFRNAGLIEANGGGATFTFSFGPQQTFRFTEPAAALAISAMGNASGTVVNEAAGRITATGRLSTAVGLIGGALDLTNDGTIVGTAGTLLAANDELAIAAGTRFLAGAVQTLGSFADVLRNRGTIIGSIDLGAGDDRVENEGALDGSLFLRGGDDTLVLSAGATLAGVADGGDGIDAILVNANGEGAFAAESFAGFESLTQTGAGAISYSGTFGIDTIRLIGGTLRVGADTSLATGGTIAVTGSDGAERVELAGALGGGIALAGGDDEFVEIGAGRASGLVDGGEGSDLYRLRLAADRTGISAVTGFERLAMEGGFTLALDLLQNFDSIALSGAGLDLRANGFTVGEIVGSEAAERVTIDSDVARVALAGGDDSLAVAADILAGAYTGGTGVDLLRLTNTGGTRLNGSLSGFEQIVLGGGSLVVAGTLGAAGETIGFGEGAQLLSVTDSGQLLGTLDFGSGDDGLTVAGQSLSGSVFGGAGADVLRLTNAGEVRLAGTVSGFERILLGGGLTISGALGAAGEQIRFGDAADAVDVAEGGQLLGLIDFGAGDDRLTFAGARLGATYAGGAGLDTLRLTNGSGVRLDGSVTGFEQILLGVGELTVAGTLGAAGERISFGEGAQAVRLVQGGTLAGSIDFGAGNDRLTLGAGTFAGTIDLGAGDDRLTLGAGTFAGTASGGAGTDLAVLELAGDRSLAPGLLTGFEQLATSGTGALTLTRGAFSFDRVESAGDLRIAAGASLAAPILFGPANNRFTIEGGFAGSVGGGAGSDTIEVSGGSAANPIAFAAIADVEAFRMSGGFATLSGQGSIGAAELTGGRLVGLAGSVLTASTLTVRQDATFGSAGVFNGSLLVAGTLSPGASPGTMTVNGNVQLAGSSTSLFEITPTAQDKLVVNGALAISQGATLRLAASNQLAPGSSFDLITASGGITGSFTNVIKPDSLFGFLSQSANRIQLLGQFRNDPDAAAQVNTTIDFTNALLVSGRASPALLAAAPALVGANGASNVAAFARIAPEAYASVQQAAVENGLTVAEAGRGTAFASRRDAPGLFTFGQFTANRRALRGDADRGTSRARFRGYGLLGGLGYQGEGWSLGAFGGYLDGNQRIDAIGARSELDGAVFGLHGRTGSGPLAVTATLAYAATEAATDRNLPDGSAGGRYDLDVWTVDLAASYDFALSDDWALRPKVGGTLLVVDREGVQESGGSAFAAQVAGERDEAAFVDASLAVAGGRAAGSTVRPFASIGLRYQLSGRNSAALAGFGGGSLGLAVEGVERARMIGIGSIGIEADLAPKLTLFGVANAERGEDDRQESVQAGIRLAF